MAVTQLVAGELKSDPFTLYRREVIPGLASYAAGFPSYPADFARDIITAGILSARADVLMSGLAVGSHYQAKEDNPYTGAEKGKIAHEKPGAILQGRDGQTDYNACDTTALFLITAEGLSHLDKSAASRVLTSIKPNLERAVEYNLGHIEDDIFIERPLKGVGGFALRVTMWKDSVLPQPEKDEPVYPVVYPQAHFIAARGLLSASRLLGEPELGALADRMFRKGIAEFMRQDGYVVYRDNEEELVQPSSDELHNLAYIPRSYGGLIPFDAIKSRAQVLETSFGYMCTPPEIAKGLSDDYHADTAWTQDNGLINYGARKFGLNHEAAVASSIATHIGEGQELFGIEVDAEGSKVPRKKGNSAQLWAVATREYFEGQSSLLNKPWL